MSRVEEALQPAANMNASSHPEAPCALTSLYEEDEVAWLERSVALIEAGDTKSLDFPHLAEFLQDMAIAQRREVKSRLVTLLQHLLKWNYQPSMRGASWSQTIQNQRRELEILFETKTLHHHGEAILADAYEMAVRYASLETGLKQDTFPRECPFTLDDAISSPLDEEDSKRE